MPSSAPYLILLQVIFVLSWSSGFIGARLGTEEAGAINLLFWRFLLVSICLLPFVVHRLRTLSWAQVRYNTVIGFLAQFAYLVSVYIAIRSGLPAGIAAIICALQPLITASMSNRGQQERSGRQEWVGLGVGFAGVSVVIFGEYNLSTTRLDLWLYALPLIAAITLSIATLYQRRQSVMATEHSKDGLLMPLFLQSTATLVLLTATGLPLGLIEVPASTQVWAAVAWLTLFSTFIAYLSLWILLTKLSATRVSALVYLEPPVTLLWAALMFGDAIHWTTYVGIAVVATGLAITRNPRRSGQEAGVEHGGTP
ncbi:MULTISPECIES: DMT family transporter [Pseudomonas]|uniref:DMT family transporter n=1 Tax=Pseudomonas TaxID=286 RepID=UPI001E35E986|nr:MULTISPECIES: DMT family transporter [Pseudomonas]MDF3925799.1 DMT family transporter [Pseudomonas putida]MDH1692968.1 DMT family transporter [Pseudomonas sp. GD03766]UFH26626.1 DMT family transporter [Pseudomonas sp. CIP-10]WPE29573.1 putative amino-acid metabolite efflux pump [Pseudomonas hunanensis]